MNKLALLFFSFFCFVNLVQAQKDSTSESTIEDMYAWRLRQSVLYGTYIPKDVNEVIMELNKKIDAPSKAKFAAVSEDTAATKLFFSLGSWMTRNWCLYEGSRLSKYMQDLGIHQPEHMAKFFIILYHRSLTKKPLDVKALIERFHQKEEEEKRKRLEKGTILHQEKRKVDKPTGN